MNAEQLEIINIFKQTGALTEGHFVLRSGLHSGHFFQCARVGEDMKCITRLAELLVDKFIDVEYSTVLAPAMGGLTIGQEVARQTEKRFIFVEKVDNKLTLRRGFKIEPDEKILIIEDVITRGGRVQEAMEIVKNEGGIVAGVGVMVDRSQGSVNFGVPTVALMQMSFPTYEPDAIPPELAAIPITKPGS